MRSRAESTLEPAWLRRAWNKVSDYAIVVLGLGLAAALIFGVYESHSSDNNSAAARSSSAAAAKSSEAALTYAKRLTAFQHAAHAQNVQYQQTIIQQQKELQYVLGVVVYLSVEVNQTINDHTGEIGALDALEKQVLTLEQSFAGSLAQIPNITASLQAGQDEIKSEYQQIISMIEGLKSQDGAP